MSLVMLISVGFVGCNKTKEEDNDAWKEDGVLKVLAIGNSFAEDTFGHIAKISEAMGVTDYKFTIAMFGGCSLKMHYNFAINETETYWYQCYEDGKDYYISNNYDVKLSYFVEEENWDFITVQQGMLDECRFTLPETYSELSPLVNWIKERCPGAKIGFNCTWADTLQSNCPELFDLHNGNQLSMYQGIIDTIKEVVEPLDTIDFIVPNMTALQNARTSYLTDKDDLSRDGLHLSLGIGRYIAGLTYFQKITGISVENIEWYPEDYELDTVDLYEYYIALESVKNAFANPYEVTQSIYV